MTISGLRQAVLERIGRRLEKPVIEGTVLGRALRFMARHYHNNSSDLAANGEIELIGRARRFCAAGECVVDVGANRGQYARAWLAPPGGVDVLSFEVDAALAAELAEQARSHGGRWQVFPFGLSDRDAEVTVWRSGASSELTSVEQPLEPGFSPGTARVRDAASLGEIAGRPIFFLKLDVEGHELAILRRVIAAGLRPRIIQFEFGSTAVAARSFLLDFCALLRADYVFGRLYRAGVDFADYDPRTAECLDMMGNYVAVLKTEPSLVSALSARR